eukprot:c40266_g1_i1 orf=375-638(+)
MTNIEAMFFSLPVACILIATQQFFSLRRYLWKGMSMCQLLKCDALSIETRVVHTKKHLYYLNLCKDLPGKFFHDKEDPQREHVFNIK